MEQNGGMVAVVQGMQDANLTVTLLDGGKQYTLMPNKHVCPAVHQPTPGKHCHGTVHCASQYTNDQYSGSTLTRGCESANQATDGTYASTYKMMHCNLRPTSPTHTVSEFPPQKSEVLHGHGNFAVGGYGSGESSRPAVKSNSFRGGMVWPDKGSVCASRASVQSDAFANSLRKYPNISPERSSEIVQRLINFTQAKNSTKNQNKTRCEPCSPNRNNLNSEASKHTFVVERNSLRNTVMIDKQTLIEESPVKESSNNFLQEDNDDYWNRPVFCRNNDVRYFRETTRKVKQGVKNVDPTTPNNVPPSRIMEQYDYQFYQRRMQEQESKRSVNMEIQAGIQMETKEILTLPRIVPMQRSVATPLSPISSKTEGRVEEELKSQFGSSTEIMHECSCKSIQVKLKEDSVQISSSSFDIRKNNYGNNNKRSRSEEELSNIKKTQPDSVLSFVQNFNNNSDVNELFSKYPVGKKKRICQNCKHLYDDFDIVRRSVSNNTYFREDFNIDQQRTSKHFIEMSKKYFINSPDRVTRENDKRMHHQLQTQPEFLSHIDTRDDKKISHGCAKQKHANKFIKPNKELRNKDYYDCERPEPLTKFVDGERYQSNDESLLSQSNKDYKQFSGNEVDKSNRYLAMTQREIRNLIDLDILAFAEKYRLNITTENLQYLNEELFDLFVTDLNNSSISNKKLMAEKIKYVLQNRGLSELQTMYLTNVLTEHWEEEFLTDNNSKLNSNFQSGTLIVLPNIIQEPTEHNQNESITNEEREFSIKGISQRDIDTNVEGYINKVSKEINEWLSNIYNPEIEDEETRQALVNDLVTDIVDRHKYLELNSTCESSETSELEHLKYQIFKLLHKLSINDVTLVDHAPDLVKRIQSIAVPIFSVQGGRDRKSNAKTTFVSLVDVEQSSQKEKVMGPSNLGASSSRYFNPGIACCERPTCKRNLNKKGIAEYFTGKSVSLREPRINDQAFTGNRRMSSPGKLASTNTDYNQGGHFSGGIKIRDDDADDKKSDTKTQITQSPLGETSPDQAYKQYVKEWVDKIPLPMTNAKDQMLAKEARTDIYNGILEAVCNLRSDRNIFNDRFLFEDRLDNEIEKLLSKLPQSPELNSKKHILKVKLIEETSNVNELIKTNSYKQQLLENVRNNVPKPTPDENQNPEFLETYEQLQILNLVEDFIICSRYENQDPRVAETYRKKLIKRTEDFVRELKENHSKALRNIDPKTYINDILNALKSVPLPSDQTIQDEADEILLAIEIEKWFSHLPVVQSNDYIDQLHRRRHRNNLAKQILDKEKGVENTERMDNLLKHEISQFLEKAPLQQGEDLNINLMVDELMKRLKDRPTKSGNDDKKVAFNKPDYDDFSENVPLSSTYREDYCKRVEAQTKDMPTNKLTRAVDLSQLSRNGRYNNISRPVFDDIRTGRTYHNGMSQEEIPHFETYNDTQHRSSLRDDVEPEWYSMQDSRQSRRQSNISQSNSRNQNRVEQGNKSIQTVGPGDQSQSRRHQSIAQPQLDNLRQEDVCCSDEQVNNDPHNSVRSRNDALEPSRYSLHERRQSYVQPPHNSFVPQPANVSQRPDDQEWVNQIENRNIPEQEFNVPPNYPIDTDYYEDQQRRDKTYSRNDFGSNRVIDIDAPLQNTNQREVSRHFNNTPRQRWSSCCSPNNGSSRRRDSQRFNQESPHRPSDFPRSPREANRSTSNRSPGFQNIIEDRRNGSPQMNRSDLFYKSTDADGIRRAIDRNKSTEGNVDRSNPSEHIPDYCHPTVLIPPCYVPVRLGGKKGHVPDRNVDETYRDEDTDDENDEQDDIRCRCLEKFCKKNKRRIRYCPVEQYEGMPMCVTSPYYYPYFY